jgi:hypothetical protein
VLRGLARIPIKAKSKSKAKRAAARPRMHSSAVGREVAMWNFVKPDTHFFTPEQRKRVEALFEAILPGSDTNPGATDANAVEYLDTLLTMVRDVLRHPQLRTLYPVGLLATEDAARARSTDAASWTHARREDAALTEPRGGQARGTSFSAKDQTRFFTELRTRCIELLRRRAGAQQGQRDVALVRLDRAGGGVQASARRGSGRPKSRSRLL